MIEVYDDPTDHAWVRVWIHTTTGGPNDGFEIRMKRADLRDLMVEAGVV